MPEPQFRPHLYRGTARYYERYRIPYPQPLIDDLTERAGATAEGSLLDLGCGTGQLAFALRHRFARILAVDSEPGMIAAVREKGGVDTLIGAAEELTLPEGSFDLVTIGCAFHRMRRDVVAANVRRWLRPGASLALAWTRSPWDGPAPWQQALSAAQDRWLARDRIPAGYPESRQARPDSMVLREAGFQIVGSYQFHDDHAWTPDELIGFLYSTSVLSRAVLGDSAAEFEQDIRRTLQPFSQEGKLMQHTDFAYELARRPM